jgi:tRNA(fMet)-specific endonuclease VapC
LAVLIDTSVLIDLERTGDSLDAAEDAAISVITVSELLHGVYRAPGRFRATRAALVERVLAELEAIPITEPVARVHAEIWSALSAKGASLAAHDLWIAATALAYGLGVVTRNARDFKRVPGLPVLAPR